MKMAHKGWIACAALALPIALVLDGPGTAVAQISSSATSAGTPLVQIIEAVAKKTGKNFIVDPRVTGNALLIGLEPSKVTYPELLQILQVHGFAAIETDSLIRIIPDAAARAAPSPVIGANDKHPDGELVTRVLRVKSISSPYLVPILRALLPQSAHLAAYSCTNELLIVDTYANVRRIESIVTSMDKGDPLPLPKCTLQPPGAPPSRDSPPARD